MEEPIYEESDLSKHRLADASDDEDESGGITIGNAPAAASESHETTTTSDDEEFADAMNELTFGSLGDEADEANADANSDYEIASQPPWPPISSIESLEQLPAAAYPAQATDSGSIRSANSYSTALEQQDNELPATSSSSKSDQAGFVFPDTTSWPASQEGDELSATNPATTDQPDFMLPTAAYEPVSKKQSDQHSATGQPDKTDQSDSILPGTSYRPFSSQQETQSPATTSSAQAQATEPRSMLPSNTYKPFFKQQIELASNVSAPSTQGAYQYLPASTYVSGSEQLGPQVPTAASSSRAQATVSDLTLTSTTYAPASTQQVRPILAVGSSTQTPYQHLAAAAYAPASNQAPKAPVAGQLSQPGAHLSSSMLPSSI